MTQKSTRSPISPSRPLGDCHSEAMKLYDIFPNTEFTQTQLASALGLSSGSGGFRSLVSDLKQYGLVEKNADGNLSVSANLKSFTVVDDDEKAAIKFAFVMHPNFFSQLIEKQGYHLPGEEKLSNLLVAQHGFNRAKAKKTARALYRSLEWANAIDDKGNIMNPCVVNNPQEENCNSDDMPTSAEALSITVDNACSMLRVDVPINDGRIVHIDYPQSISPSEAKKVGAVLSALSSQE